MSESLTVKEAAQICKVQDRTIRDWIKQGKLKAMRLGKTYRLARLDVEALFHPVIAAPEPGMYLASKGMKGEEPSNE